MRKVSKMFLIPFLFVANVSFAQNPDIKLLDRISTNRNQASDPFYQGITDAAGFVAIGSSVSQIGIGLLTKNKEVTEKGILSGVALFGTYGVGYLLKKGINRERPYEKYPFINNYKIENDASFPSGSTAVAFSMATSLTTNYPKWYVAVPAFGFASAVGYSRMRLGAHYPTDVFAGALLGAGSVFVTNKLNKWIRK